MARPRHGIPFAVSSTGAAADVRGVERGLACGCTCPSCGEPVIAKQGQDRTWHFAHQSGAACAGALESALHLAAKEVLAAAKQLWLPKLTVVRWPQHLRLVPYGVIEYGPDRVSYLRNEFDLVEDVAKREHAGVARLQHQTVRFDQVVVEQSEGAIRPDLIGVVRDRQLLIEIAVTHFVDAEKLAKIRARRLPAIEIDLADLYESGGADVSLESLKGLLTEDRHRIKWLFHPALEALALEDHARRQPAREAELAAREQAKLREQRRQEARRAREARDAARREAQRAEKARREEVERLEAERARAEEDAARLERMRIEREQERKREVERKEAETARKAQVEAECEQLRAKRAAEDAAYRRSLTLGGPSPELPPDGIPLILDFDGLFSPQRQQAEEQIALFAQALGETHCFVVLSSEVRYGPWQETVIPLLAKIGARRVATTPILDRTNPYGNHAKEIEAWLRHDGRHVRGWIVLDTARRGMTDFLKPGLLPISPLTGFTREDGELLRRRLEVHERRRQDAFEEHLRERLKDPNYRG